MSAVARGNCADTASDASTVAAAGDGPAREQQGREPQCPARPALTPCQRRVLSFIQHKQQQQQITPSVREIGQACGRINTNSVQGHLRALKKKGYIRREARLARWIQIIE